MRIVRATVRRYRLPLVRPLVTARGTVAEREGMLVRLETDSGLSGFGEASPAWWIGEDSIDETAKRLHAIVERPKAWRAEALRAVADAAPPSVRCALDSALCDLEARTGSRPLAALLAERPLSEVEVALLVEGESAGDLAARARAAAAAGYRTLKLKVGGRPLRDDRERVAAVRDGAGREVAIRLDANRAWTANEAREAVAALAGFGIALFEEPLRDPDPVSLAALRREGAAVGLDESVSDEESLRRYLDSGAADALVLKAARLGGPQAALRLARTAASAGLRVIVTDSIETSVGRAVAVHLAAAVTGGEAVGLGGAALLAGDVRRDPLGAAPRCRVPGPGLGVADEGSDGGA